MSAAPTLYSHYVADDACRYHRLLLPGRFLGPRHPELRWVVGGDPHPDGHAAYAVHGMPTYQTVRLAGRWKRSGAAFVYSCDDDYFNLPTWNPVKAADAELDLLGACHDLADLILCSTEALGDTFRRRGYGHKVCVAPNLLDLDQYPTVPPPEPEPGKPVRVLWAGSFTHAEDVAGLAEGVAAALAVAGPDRLEVGFLGGAPPHPLLMQFLHKGVLWRPPVAFQDYWSALTIFAPHVYLAPMAECEFNRSKSALRVNEGFALHACVLASPFGEYGPAIDHTVTGVHVNSAQDWCDALCTLLAKPERRREIAAAGRKVVEQRWAWQNAACHSAWDDFVSRLVAVIRSKRG